MNKKNLPIKEIIERYVQGTSENAIAKQYKVSRGTIRQRLVESRVHIRTQSEAEKLKWTYMTLEQREHQIKAYHDKIRGDKRSHESLVKRAKTIQAYCRLSPLEKLIWKMFELNNVEVVPLYAVDIFNVDFAIPKKKVAFEVNTGNWHKSPRKIAQDAKKAKYLESQGWLIKELRVGLLSSPSKGESLVKAMQFDYSLNPTSPK